MGTWVRNNRRRLLLGFVAVAVLGVVIPVAYNQPFFRPHPKRLQTVQDHVLYRSAQPTSRQLPRLVDEYGIRTLLIVREGDSERVADELTFAREHGLKAVHIPIVSRQPIPDDQVRQFFQCVDDPANQPILVHCSAGRHRTGYLCALYRIERQGWSVAQALDEMLSFTFDKERQPAVLDQLRNYRPQGSSLPTTMSSGVWPGGLPFSATCRRDSAPLQSGHPFSRDPDPDVHRDRDRESASRFLKGPPLS